MAKHSDIDHSALAGIAFAGVRLSNTAAQTIGTASFTALTFDTEQFDTDGFHSTVTNTSRITIPSGKAGKYHIGGMIGWATNTTGDRAVQIYLNGTTRIADVGTESSATGTTVRGRTAIDTIYDLAVADYVELRVYQDSGGNLNTLQTGTSLPQFWAYRLG